MINKTTRIPIKYRDFTEVASTKKALILLEYNKNNLYINLVLGSNPPYMPIYNLLTLELKVL